MDVDQSIASVEEILASLDKDQATKVIDFLKTKADEKKKPVEPKVEEGTEAALEPNEENVQA